MRHKSHLESSSSLGAYGFLLPREEREKNKEGHTHERGAALVTVLLAVTLLTVVVVEFTYSAQVDHHLTYNALKALQATYLARSGVNLAMLALKKDIQNSAIDSLGDDWARALPPLPAGEGVVLVRVSDEQGKLNLNALRTANGTINGRWREVAERLFALRDLDPGLLDPLLDWLDRDDFPEPRGAERIHYLSLIPPYVPRNDLLLTLGELGRIEGFTPAIRARLDEVVTVLPSNNTKINVNTAPLEVLAALFPAVEQAALEQFLRSRVETPAHGPTDLRERLRFTPRSPVDALTLTDVRSEFFAVHALATVAPISQGLTVIVQRRAAAVTPIYWHPAPLLSVSEGTT
jgi:general secretion pathway protein K